MNAGLIKRLGAGLVVLLAIVVGVTWWFRTSRRAELVDVVTGDDRMWLIYSDNDAEGWRGGRTTIESIDLATGDLVWTNSMSAVPSGPTSLGGRGSLATEGALIFRGRPSERTTEVVAMDSDTGSLRWRMKIDGSPWTFGSLLSVSDVVLAFTSTNGMHVTITAIDVERGEKLWTADVSEDVLGPRPASEGLALSSKDAVLWFDAHTGNRTKIELPESESRTHFVPLLDLGDGRLATFDRGRRLETSLDAPEWVTVREYTPPPASTWTSLDIPECGVGFRQDDPVLLLRDSMLRYGPQGKHLWSVSFPEGFTALSMCRRYVDPSSDTTLEYPARYAPVVLARHRNGPPAQMLAVVDLDRGTLAWQSQILEQARLGAWTQAMAFRSESFYGIPVVLGTGETDRRYFFGFDGDSGRFTLALDLTETDRGARMELSPPHAPWLVRPAKVFGASSPGAVWAFDRRTRRTDHLRHTDGAPSHDDELVSAVFGSAP